MSEIMNTQLSRGVCLGPLLLGVMFGVSGCDNRPLYSGTDGGATVADASGNGADLQSSDGSTADAQPSRLRCVLAQRQLPCTYEHVAATVEEVKKDPCLSSYAVDEEPGPEQCDLIWEPCAMAPPSRPPSYLVGPAPDDSGCVFVDECASAMDCMIANDCRDPNACCGYDVPLPISLVETEPCVVIADAPAPGPGCGERCLDWPGGADSDRPAEPPQELECLPNPEHSSLRICTRPIAPLEQGYLLWQAPGGEAGTGPAIEILPDGTVRRWINTYSLKAHQASGWDWEMNIGVAQVAQLFTLLNQVDYTQLPHTNSYWSECYPHLYFEPCAGCAPRVIDYASAPDLKPEMNAVYSWFQQQIPTGPSELPPTFCVMEAANTACGGELCDPAAEICVINEGWAESASCQPLPEKCSWDRGCACVGAEVCQGAFTHCSDIPEANTVTCECLNC